MTRIVEITNLIQRDNPSIQLFWTKDQNAIGYWNHTLGRVQVLVAELLGGSWASMPELLVNGEPCINPDSWEPCRYENLA
jgi:hypothetical protein